jgi:hypothetical protein
MLAKALEKKEQYCKHVMCREHEKSPLLPYSIAL